MISKSEISRKSIHFANSLIPLGYYFLPVEKWQYLTAIGIGLLISLIFDLGRMEKGFVSSIFHKYFNWMLREKEMKGTLTGATWVMIAAFTMIAIFPKPIAVLSLLFMSFGDSFAALTGLGIGKVRLIGSKTLEGSIACFLACMLVGSFFHEITPVVRFIGALGATFVELLPVPLDDNFSIPFISGIVMILAGMLI